MGQYTSYYLYQKFEKRGEQDFIPVYPNTYSVDADGTMPKVIKEENDVNCGYVPPSDPIYQWVQLTPSSDPSSYWCDNCPAEPIYTWTVMTPTSDPDTYWCDDCPIEPIYRWADSGTTCVGYDKYQRAIKQVSYDNGSTWENVSPAEYSATTLIEAYSVDCGYAKLYARYSDSTTYSVSCNTSTTLSQTEVRGHSTAYSSMTSAEIGGDCVTIIGNNAFYYCSGLTSIDIPNSVTSIGAGAFSNCSSLTNVTIPSGVTSISEQVFYQCSGLTSIDIPDSVTSIGSSAFRKCSNLASVTIGSGITSIGNNAFQLCISLTSIDIPNSITEIGNSAFYQCSGLTSVTIPSGVTSIGSSALFGCYSLTGITVTAVTPPTLGGSALSGTNDCPIYVPSGSVNDYKTAWSLYEDRIQAIT